MESLFAIAHLCYGTLVSLLGVSCNILFRLPIADTWRSLPDQCLFDRHPKNEISIFKTEAESVRADDGVQKPTVGFYHNLPECQSSAKLDVQ